MTMYGQAFAAAGRSRMSGFSSCAKQRHKNVSFHKISQHLEDGVLAQSWMASDLESINKKNGN